MIRKRFQPKELVESRRGYTLFEVLLALGLSSLLMLLVYGAMESYWRLDTLGRLDAERCQLARTLIRRMEMDIRSVTFKPADTSSTTTTSGTQAADEGASNTQAGSGTQPQAQTTNTAQTQDATTTPLISAVHLVGTSQSLEMIVLKPFRNRTGSLQDELYADSQSDRRKVGYMFSTSGTPGLYYRNVDQLVEQMLEAQGSLPDPSADYTLLAPEVADLQFQYLDGTTNSWVTGWHSGDMGALPRAIKITLQFHPASMASSNRLRQSTTSASTEVFQTVVHLPLSDVPLEL